MTAISGPPRPKSPICTGARREPCVGLRGDSATAGATVRARVPLKGACVKLKADDDMTRPASSSTLKDCIA
eukprot:5342217-Prymnesium_polylepis.1